MVDPLEGLHGLQVRPLSVAAQPRHVVVGAGGGDLD